MLTAQDIIKGMIASLHQRHLKGLGFRKTSNTWVNPVDWPQVINVQLSQWNSAEEAKITLNLGISIEALHKAADGLPLNGALKEYDCDVRSRIGQLRTDKLDKWWTVIPTTNADQLADQLFGEIVTYGLPWFDRLRTNAAIAEEFVALKNSFMAAVAYLLDGNRTEAEKWMNEAFAKSNKHALPKLKRFALAHSLTIPG